MAETSMSSQLVMATSAAQPAVTAVYDAHKGHYHDPVCDTPAAPAYMPLPATPTPFANLRKP